MFQDERLAVIIALVSPTEGFTMLPWRPWEVSLVVPKALQKDGISKRKTTKSCGKLTKSKLTVTIGNNQFTTWCFKTYELY